MSRKLMQGSEPIAIPGNENGVLMLHGFTSSPHEMGGLAAFLKDSGYTIRAPLLSGHGTTEKNLQKCKWSDWYSDTKKALFEMRKTCKKIVVVGLSTGGSLALHLSAHYQVEGIVALSPGIYLKKKSTRLIPYAWPFIRYQNKKDGPDISDKEAREKAVGYDRTPLKAANQVLKLYDHLKSDLQDIYVPTLLIHSKNDHIVDYKSSKYIYKTISSKQKRLLWLDKSYHVLTLDVEKTIVFREIQKFLSDIFNKNK